MTTLRRVKRNGPLLPPNTRAHWLAYFIARFNRYGLDTSAHMALFYMLLILRDGGEGKPMPDPPALPLDSLLSKRWKKLTK